MDGKRNKIFVNGSEMDVAFFKENLREAMSVKWAVAEPIKSGEHAHCIICLIAISENDKIYYKSSNGALCNYCYENFIKTQA